VKFPAMNDKQVREYVSFLLKQYRLVDAFWFLAVEDTFGTEAAVNVNEKVWSSIGRRAAGEIRDRFSLEEEGVGRVLEALSYYPWYLVVRQEIDETPHGARIRVRHCLPQEARIKAGKGEFPCKARNLAELANFAKEIDERVEVRCLMAPPDPHPEDLWCEWQLALKSAG
jgi:hypothetical protein